MQQRMSWYAFLFLPRFAERVVADRDFASWSADRRMSPRSPFGPEERYAAPHAPARRPDRRDVTTPPWAPAARPDPARDAPLGRGRPGADALRRRRAGRPSAPRSTPPGRAPRRRPAPAPGGRRGPLPHLEDPRRPAGHRRLPAHKPDSQGFWAWPGGRSRLSLRPSLRRASCGRRGVIGLAWPGPDEPGAPPRGGAGAESTTTDARKAAQQRPAPSEGGAAGCRRARPARRATQRARKRPAVRIYRNRCEDGVQPPAGAAAPCPDPDPFITAQTPRRSEAPGAQRPAIPASTPSMPSSGGPWAAAGCAGEQPGAGIVERGPEHADLANPSLFHALLGRPARSGNMLDPRRVSSPEPFASPVAKPRVADGPPSPTSEPSETSIRSSIRQHQAVAGEAAPVAQHASVMSPPPAWSTQGQPHRPPVHHRRAVGVELGTSPWSVNAPRARPEAERRPLRQPRVGELVLGLAVDGAVAGRTTGAEEPGRGRAPTGAGRPHRRAVPARPRARGGSRSRPPRARSPGRCWPSRAPCRHRRRRRACARRARSGSGPPSARPGSRCTGSPARRAAAPRARAAAPGYRAGRSVGPLGVGVRPGWRRC